jgi:hypothetical protein
MDHDPANMGLAVNLARVREVGRVRDECVRAGYLNPLVYQEAGPAPSVFFSGTSVTFTYRLVLRYFFAAS